MGKNTIGPPLHMHSTDLTRSSSRASADDLVHALDACNMQQDLDLPLLAATTEEKEQWAKMLFCKVFASYFEDENTLRIELKKIWNTEEDFKVQHIKSGIFMVEITNLELQNFLVANSPWCVKGLCMGVRH